jgi:hypothetical protein
MSQVKEFKPLKLWISGETKPLEYTSSIEALKDVKSIQNATSASIEITERVDSDGSTISAKSAAGLRNWAIKELNAIQRGNKKLSFMDVKYVPKDVKGDKVTGEIKEYPAKLLFRVATPRDME